MRPTAPTAGVFANFVKAICRPIFSRKPAIQYSSSRFAVVSSCPSPTCLCAETPAGLDIERKQDISTSMAPYAQQVLISTGKSDWTSRIEDDGKDEPWGDFGRSLKAMLGRGGKYADVCRYVLSSAPGEKKDFGVEV